MSGVDPAAAAPPGAAPSLGGMGGMPGVGSGLSGLSGLGQQFGDLLSGLLPAAGDALGGTGLDETIDEPDPDERNTDDDLEGFDDPEDVEDHEGLDDDSEPDDETTGDDPVDEEAASTDATEKSGEDHCATVGSAAPPAGEPVTEVADASDGEREPAVAPSDPPAPTPAPLAAELPPDAAPEPAATPCAIAADELPQVGE